MEITFSLPKKQFVTESPDEVAAKVRLYAALGMYQGGELSIGAACELAGIDRYFFAEIMMSDNIPHTGNPPPFYCRVLIANFNRHLFDCFTDDLDITQNGVINQVVFHKLIKRQISCVVYDPAAGFENIFQVETKLTRHRRYLVECKVLDAGERLRQ